MVAHFKTLLETLLTSNRLTPTTNFTLDRKLIGAPVLLRCKTPVSAVKRGRRS